MAGIIWGGVVSAVPSLSSPVIYKVEFVFGCIALPIVILHFAVIVMYGVKNTKPFKRFGPKFH
jgi:hypothetical protein